MDLDVFWHHHAIYFTMGLGWLLQQKGKALFELFGRGFDLASLVMIAGGLFLIYKTVMEIHHKLRRRRRNQSIWQ